MIIKETKFAEDTLKEPLLEVKLSNIIGKFLGTLRTDSYIFISHKHGEEDNVHRLISLLEKHGFSGYVDWGDDSMPEETSGETAIKIKEKINKSYKFILLATNSAINSKWCNWEVGYADAFKYIDHIALLPLRNENDEFKGKEYLKIYPSIQIRNNLSYLESEYYINYPDGKEISFKNWLKL